MPRNLKMAGKLTHPAFHSLFRLYQSHQTCASALLAVNGLINLAVLETGILSSFPLATGSIMSFCETWLWVSVFLPTTQQMQKCPGRAGFVQPVLPWPETASQRNSGSHRSPHLDPEARTEKTVLLPGCEGQLGLPAPWRSSSCTAISCRQTLGLSNWLEAGLNSQGALVSTH